MHVTGGLRGAHAATIMAVDWERDEYLRGIRDAEFGHLGGTSANARTYDRTAP